MDRKLIAVAALFTLPTAHADETLRCGRWLVDASASVQELLDKCGNPDEMRSEEKDIRRLGAEGRGMIKVGTTFTHYWTYKRGTQAAAFIVTIEENKIRSIKRAGE